MVGKSHNQYILLYINLNLFCILGQNGTLLGYVYRISINGDMQYSNDVVIDKSEIAPVKIYASSPMKDAFTTDVGQVWEMRINNLVIKGIHI